MQRIVGGILVLLLAVPALRAEDKPKDKPMTPEEQYKALLKDYSDAAGQAKTPQERNKVFQEHSPKFLELAEKNPKDPAAVDALVWVVTNDRAGGKDSPRAKALALLGKDHVRSDKLAPLCQGLTSGFDKEGTEFLRAALDKNPSKDVQAEACLALAQRANLMVRIAQILKENPGDAKRFEPMLGKEQVEDLLKGGTAKAEAEAASLYKQIGDKYAAEMKPDRLVPLCQNLSRSGAVGERLLRALLEKDKRPEVQGVACLSLAQSLKGRADELPEAQAKDAEKLRKESENLFERAADKYADVKFGRGGKVGDTAKTELFELRFLSIGKVAPDIEGEDIDGKKFKLSDYRGKVVMLDFWGHW